MVQGAGYYKGLLSGDKPMNTVDVSALKENLPKYLDRVNDDHAPLLVTRASGKPAILMSLEDYNAYEETAYLMASPRNAQRLDESIAALSKGEGTIHELLEE